MYVKIHDANDERVVVAICDENVLGKVFEEEDLMLLLEESFYKGTILDEKKVKEIILDATNLNIAGEESIKLCLRMGIIEEEDIKRIKNIPFVCILDLG